MDGGCNVAQKDFFAPYFAHPYAATMDDSSRMYLACSASLGAKGAFDSNTPVQFIAKLIYLC